ncbi:MAG: tRNA lysidine(34) synthetase TilS [Gammaproteobacteria bacterium]|nr:tRNA lysidine(34) synthetase TilS [Gammaproteobacteria bacterium]
MDSHVLLHRFASLRNKFPNKISLRAIYVNHGLSSKADDWAEHCCAICRDLDVEFIVKKITIIKKKGHSLEAIARDLRYQVIADFLLDGEILLTAHHANDQAETVLLQLLRGAGVNGLAAMPGRKKFAHSYLLRPLLKFTRYELYSYAKEHNLCWIEDESNENTGFERNFIRHEIFPKLLERSTGLIDSINRAAHHQQEALGLLQELAFADYEYIGDIQHGYRVLRIDELLKLNLPRRKNLIRYWLLSLELPLPSSKKIQHIMHDVLLAKDDKNPLVSWSGAEVRRYRNHLYAMPPLNGEVELPKNLDLPVGAVVRFRLPGDKINLPKRNLIYSLSKYFQEQGVPVWLRDRLPLICKDGLVIKVGDCVH